MVELKLQHQAFYLNCLIRKRRQRHFTRYSVVAVRPSLTGNCQETPTQITTVESCQEPIAESDFAESDFAKVTVRRHSV